MSTALQPTAEQPLRFNTGTFQTVESGPESQTAVLLREVALPEPNIGNIPATLMVVATDHDSGMAADRALDRFQRALTSGNQPDTAARLKTAFRAVNQELHDGQVGEVSMVAMIARDKYASFASVGDNEAVLYRANRINQVTRNQRTGQAVNRRNVRRDTTDQTTSVFLGSQPKLDSKLPAIFDITLLPLDAVALLSGHVARELTQATTTSALVAPGQTFTSLIERQVRDDDDPQGAAAVLEVLPIRDALVEPPEAVAAAPSYMPYIIIVVAMVAGLLFILWWFFM